MARFTLIAIIMSSLLALAGARADDFKREGTKAQRALKDPLENKAPPRLQVKGWINADDNELKLADLKGKVVIIDFWGVWCPPCRRAIPHLKELYAKHKKDGLVVIGIHTSRLADKMPEYVKKEGINYPVAVDVNRKTVQAFRVDSYPDYYVIDRSGKLLVADLQNVELDRVVATLLKKK